jgi:UDP-glucuronate 4-epimerase
VKFLWKVTPVRYLVTGVAGFIGSNLAARLAASGHVVVGIDSFNDYYSPELKLSRKKNLLNPHRIKVHEFDLCDLNRTSQVVQDLKPDSIFHLAAQPGVRIPLGSSNLYVQNNLVAHANILQTAVEYEVPNFLYASSSSVYGNSTADTFSEDDNSIQPISIYGATKLANEILTPAFVKRSNTRARGLRFFTVYGPWGRPDMAYFRLIEAAINGTNFTKFGGGEIKRDFTYVDDITSMIESLDKQLCETPIGHSDVVNIGGGKPYSLNDLIEIISAKSDLQLDMKVEESNPNDTRYTSADVEKLISLVGEKPEVDLDSGVSRTFAWASQSDVKQHLLTWIKSTI